MGLGSADLISVQRLLGGRGRKATSHGARFGAMALLAFFLVLIKGCIFLFVVLFWPEPAFAANINAASCSQTDVQNAINSAANGDTVLVPAGSCAWSTVNMPSTIGITVQGGNGGTTTIASGGFVLNQNGTTLSRITGFTFNGQANCSTGTPIQTFGSAGSAAFRIDHNTFSNSALSIMLCISGRVKGLVDHNTFTAGYASEIIHLLGDPASWSSDVVPGSSSMVFIEDNTFNLVTSTGSYAQSEEAYNGAVFVFRHNTLNGTCNDVHGGTNGGRWTEIYQNTYNVNTAGSQYCYMDIRGGSGIIWGNSSSSTTISPGVRIGPLCGSSDICTGTWPISMQVGRGILGTTYSPLYIFGNDAKMTSDISDSGGGQTLVAIGPAATSTSCSLHPGNVCDTVNAGASQPANMLRCQSSADVTAGCPVQYSYTPYVYPHPLQNAPPPPQPPSALAAVIQ